MLRVLHRGSPGFDEPGEEPGWRLPEDAVWIDLIGPSRAEELKIEQALGLQLPTREDMAEIEPSSRLYQEGGATFMTAVVLTNADTEAPVAAPVTFVLTGDKLVTIRYEEPRSVRVFSAQAERQPALCPTGATTFLNLIDAVVDRTADVIEKIAADVESISTAVFARPRERSFDDFLYRLGRAQTTNAKIRDSLVSLARLASFASLATEIENDREHREHLRTMSRDVQSLLDHSAYVSSNVNFLMDAALGLINLEQSNVTKIFSIAAVVFLPPTLVASIYGMNFEFMPELHWLFGYPFALGLMVLSVIASLLWFKSRGWL
jgi:magnesium transporter